jgi:hypothetical protein
MLRREEVYERREEAGGEGDGYSRGGEGGVGEEGKRVPLSFLEHPVYTFFFLCKYPVWFIE